MLFLLCLTYSTLAIIVAGIFGRHILGVLSVALTGIGLMGLTERLFRRHHDVAWSGGNAEIASIQLVRDLVVMLGGVLVAYAIFTLVVSPQQAMKIFSFQVRSGIIHQMVVAEKLSTQFFITLKMGVIVLIFAFILGSIYKEGGLALTIAWIGSFWGVGLDTILRRPFGPIGAVNVMLIVISFVTAACAYILAGTIGLFLSRGLQKYTIRSPEVKAIAHTCLLLCGLVMVLLLVAGFVSALVGTRLPHERILEVLQA